MEWWKDAKKNQSSMFSSVFSVTSDRKSNGRLFQPWYRRSWISGTSLNLLLFNLKTWSLCFRKSMIMKIMHILPGFTNCTMAKSGHKGSRNRNCARRKSLWGNWKGYIEIPTIWGVQRNEKGWTRFILHKEIKFSTMFRNIMMLILMPYEIQDIYTIYRIMFYFQRLTYSYWLKY